MTADVELLPCPFCGGQPHMKSDSDVDGCYWSKVRCGICGAATRGKWASSSANTCPQWYAEAREEWNTRACVAHATAAKDAEIEALRADAERYRCLRAQNVIAVTSHDQSVAYQGDDLDAEVDRVRSEEGRKA